MTVFKLFYNDLRQGGSLVNK